MKKALLILFLLNISTLYAKDRETVKVYILAGQSNMQGLGKTADLKAPYSKAFDKVNIWQANNWAPINPQSTKSFGPELSFGHEIAKIFPQQKIFLIKYAATGTALYNDWSPTLKGQQYLGFMRTLKAALSHLKKANIKY